LEDLVTFQTILKIWRDGGLPSPHKSGAGEHSVGEQHSVLAAPRVPDTPRFGSLLIG